MTAEQWVELIIRRAAELRAVGVLRVSAEGYTAELAPHIPELAHADHRASSSEELDPLEDPATYGGGKVPGYEIPTSDRRDDEEQIQ